MASSFKGMVGKALATQRMRATIQQNEQLARSAKVAVSPLQGGSSGKFLFVPNPNCCPKCSQLGLSPHFFNTGDVAFISHPNCKCATIEVPAGLSPEETMEWAKHPVGVMRYGWNYGQSFAPVNITEKNRFNNFLKWHNRVRPTEGQPRTRRQVRATASEEQIKKIRRAVKRGTLGPAEELTADLQRRAEAQRIARHIEEVRNNARHLKKGSTWNPNGKKRVPKSKAVTSTPKNETRFAKNTTSRIVKKNTDIGSIRGSGFARMSFNKERQRKKKREELLRRLGLID